MKYLFIPLIAGVLMSASCQNTNTNQSTTTTTDSAEVVATNESVPYTIAKRYFLKNNVSAIANPKIESLEQFEEYFGAAATMGPDGMPTLIDFTKQYVIAVAIPENNHEVEIKPVSLEKNQNNEIVLNYKVEQGDAISFTVSANLILIVDKEYDGTVIVNKVD